MNLPYNQLFMRQTITKEIIKTMNVQDMTMSQLKQRTAGVFLYLRFPLFAECFFIDNLSDLSTKG